MGRELKRILYVEDESDIRTVTAMALEAVGGFTVISCWIICRNSIASGIDVCRDANKPCSLDF